MKTDSEKKAACSTNLRMRDMRQRDILPKDKLENTHATVIGTGAVGRQLALQLASMGVGKIQMFDFDTVEEVNLAPQGFAEDDIGKSKVDAVAESCRKMNSEIEIIPVNSRFLRASDIGNVVFCCVDSIRIREFIWDVIGDKDVELFVDGRMAAEALRVVTAYDDESNKYYKETLFSEEDAMEAPCTAKSTIYCANICAGLMITQYAKWMRNIPIDRDMLINLVTNDFIVEDIK